MVAFRCRGRGGRIRTGGLLLPKQAICQTDLRPARADGTRRRWASPATSSSADDRWTAGRDGLRARAQRQILRIAVRTFSVTASRTTDDDDVRRIESPELGGHGAGSDVPGTRSSGPFRRPAIGPAVRPSGKAVPVATYTVEGPFAANEAALSAAADAYRSVPETRVTVPNAAQPGSDAASDRAGAAHDHDPIRAEPPQLGEGRIGNRARPDQEQRRASRGGDRAGGEGVRDSPHRWRRRPWTRTRMRRG